jgi:hypothetical protein
MLPSEPYEQIGPQQGPLKLVQGLGQEEIADPSHEWISMFGVSIVVGSGSAGRMQSVS